MESRSRTARRFFLQARLRTEPSGSTQTSGHFTTSTYYMEHLPEWARAFNAGGRPAQAAREANAEGTTQFFDLVGRHACRQQL